MHFMVYLAALLACVVVGAAAVAAGSPFQYLPSCYWPHADAAVRPCRLVCPGHCGKRLEYCVCFPRYVYRESSCEWLTLSTQLTKLSAHSTQTCRGAQQSGLAQLFAVGRAPFLQPQCLHTTCQHGSEGHQQLHELRHGEQVMQLFTSYSIKLEPLGILTHCFTSSSAGRWVWGGWSE